MTRFSGRGGGGLPLRCIFDYFMQFTKQAPDLHFLKLTYNLKYIGLMRKKLISSHLKQNSVEKQFRVEVLWNYRMILHVRLHLQALNYWKLCSKNNILFKSIYTGFEDQKGFFRGGKLKFSDHVSTNFLLYLASVLWNLQAKTEYRSHNIWRFFSMKSSREREKTYWSTIVVSDSFLSVFFVDKMKRQWYMYFALNSCWLLY